jgi:lysylphosphatidylglycerol synthetase-like protein (DUF2156 family)
MLMLSWLPIVLPAAGIFAFEYSSSDPGTQRAVFQILRGPMQRPDLAVQAMRDPSSARHEVWSTLILAFFRYPQLSAMVLLVGLIAPMLVSYDLRSKAYLQYFSRPLSPTEYILGKSAVVWFFLGMIVTIPAMMLYVVGVLLSPDISVVNQTWDIPFRILAASVVLVVPTTALALCYSSWTSESRYASFAWFATWVMGFVAYQILTFGGVRPRGGRDGRRRGGPSWEELGIDFDKWHLLSPYHTLGKVESWIFDLDKNDGTVVPAIVLLVVITIVGTWIVRHRIIARLSV